MREICACCVFYKPVDGREVSEYCDKETVYVQERGICKNKHSFRYNQLVNYYEQCPDFAPRYPDWDKEQGW